MGKKHRKADEAMEAQGLQSAYDKLLGQIRAWKLEEVLEAVKQGALSEVGEEERSSLCQELLALRNMKIADALVKQVGYLDGDMFALMDMKNWNNREFANRVIARYKKKFHWEQEEACEKMVKLACDLNNPSLAMGLVKKKKGVKQYGMLAGASEDLFLCLLRADQSLFSPEDRRQILLGAACSENPVERLKRLKAAGYPLEEKDKEGKTLENDMQERVGSTRYSKNRGGELRRRKSKEALQYLQQDRSNQTEGGKEAGTGKRRAVALAGGIAVLGIAAACIGYFSIKPAQSSAQQEEETVAETEAAEESTQETAAQSETEGAQETTAQE